MKIKTLIVALLMASGIAVNAQTTSTATPARIQAAAALLDASGLEKSLSGVYNTMIEGFSGQVPADKKPKFKQVMLAFMNKYMSYASLKQDMAKLYAEEFTEAELKDIAKFYLTPAGQKLNAKLPVLTQKGMALGQAKVQAHMAELQADIKAAFPNQ